MLEKVHKQVHIKDTNAWLLTLLENKFYTGNSATIIEQKKQESIQDGRWFKYLPMHYYTPHCNQQMYFELEKCSDGYYLQISSHPEHPLVFISCSYFSISNLFSKYYHRTTIALSYIGMGYNMATFTEGMYRSTNVT